MPLIKPPNDYDESSHSDKPELTEWEDARRIELFLDVKPWVCSCGGTNFGRNKFCADFKCKLPRPKDWKFQKRNA